ncbi:CPBP family intramembrane glutamic endopeptidase [Haliangium ochraceum]|uniref:Abortive infection protein n=1 Tax=Haliangium ochraceum (strain DSM 14365 / JCM 11303 / SMP-2) TaxID=502025 RepID=D0LRD7_HALO1|nr:CPBP family intramembrane glutamic endopeptidase [Haliangium ochraceum]ACY17165.1 Abortive infection protein [Haliangium ochraceum DSM 14365]
MATNARTTTPSPSVFGHGDLIASLILIFPLFLAYEVGVMFSSTVNGVDFATRFLFAALGNDRDTWLLVQFGLAVLFFGFVMFMRQRCELSRDAVLSMLGEAVIYALTLGTFIVFVMQELLGFSLEATHTALGAIGDGLVVSLGAGVYEELVFRLGMMAGGIALLRWGGMTHGFSVVVALFGSALAFSLAHHLGPYGELFEMRVFVYRALAGVIFGLVFYYRSLAHAVYTHFLYDLYVLVIRG